jgi:ABC-type uncharacterized transport system substrate-binding protein
VTTRRAFLCGLGVSALGAPLTVLAQQSPPKVARIGFLGAASPAGYSSRITALKEGFAEFGYVEGRNLVIEYRWTGDDSTRLDELAADLVRTKVDVIVTSGTPAIQAAKRSTSTIPIVMAASGDAAATGLVQSLARPGGNVTGSTFSEPDLVAKRVELLKEVMPRVSQVGCLINTGASDYGRTGGMVGYGPDVAFLWRRAAYFVDRILKGARPADLPVEQPTRYELVINMKTARALGVSIAQEVLVRAEKVIE